VTGTPALRDLRAVRDQPFWTAVDPEEDVDAGRRADFRVRRAADPDLAEVPCRQARARDAVVRFGFVDESPWKAELLEEVEVRLHVTHEELRADQLVPALGWRRLLFGHGRLLLHDRVDPFIVDRAPLAPAGLHRSV